MSANPQSPAASGLLVDSFERVRALVSGYTDGLSVEVATFRPDDQANPIGWLLWHLSRVQDDHMADLAGVEQVWPAWRERFGLPFEPDETGYGHRAEDVIEVRVSGGLLASYHADVHALTMRYLERIDADELARVVDTRWDPPVTAGARLVSVLSDVSQHLGQVGYVHGLAGRRSGVDRGR